MVVSESDRMRAFLAFTLGVAVIGVVESRPKSWREGPTVDPGVFVITHIRCEIDILWVLFTSAGRVGMVLVTASLATPVM